MLCDRIGIIDYGKIVALDTPSNLKRLISGTETTVVELDIPNLTNDLVGQIKGLSAVRNVIMKGDTQVKVQASGDEAFDNIIDTVRSNKGRISSVKNLEPTLEDVFLHITGHGVRDQATGRPDTSGGHHGPHGRPKSRIR
jgi:ABC-2 type transport system ATP-binding protein